MSRQSLVGRAPLIFEALQSHSIRRIMASDTHIWVPSVWTRKMLDI